VFHVTVFKWVSYVSGCKILWLTQTEVMCSIHLKDYVIAKSQESFKQGAVSTLWNLPDDWEIKTGKGANLRLLSLILSPVLFFEFPHRRRIVSYIFSRYYMNKSGLYGMFIIVRKHYNKLQGVGRHGCSQWVECPSHRWNDSALLIMVISTVGN